MNASVEVIATLVAHTAEGDVKIIVRAFYGHAYYRVHVADGLLADGTPGITFPTLSAAMERASRELIAAIDD